MSVGWAAGQQHGVGGRAHRQVELRCSNELTIAVESILTMWLAGTWAALCSYFMHVRVCFDCVRLRVSRH